MGFPTRVRGGVNPPLEKGMGGFCGTQDSFRGSTRQRPEASADSYVWKTPAGGKENSYRSNSCSFPTMSDIDLLFLSSGWYARRHFLGTGTNGPPPFRLILGVFWIWKLLERPFWSMLAPKMHPKQRDIFGDPFFPNDSLDWGTPLNKE